MYFVINGETLSELIELELYKILFDFAKDLACSKFDVA